MSVKNVESLTQTQNVQDMKHKSQTVNLTEIDEQINKKFNDLKI